MRDDSTGTLTDGGELPASPGPVAPLTGAGEEGPFSRETLALLHGLPVAVAEQWAHAGLLVVVARLAAEDAHRAGLPIARALIALKTAWSRVPEVRPLPQSDHRELLERLVTGCIEAYYAPPSAPASAAPRGPLRLLPDDNPRTQLDAVAAALLETVDGLVPEARARGAEWAHGTGDARPASDPELEHRVEQALAGMPTEEVMALIVALRRLHVSLRANHGRPAQGHRSAASVQFRPPRP